MAPRPRTRAAGQAHGRTPDGGKAQMEEGPRVRRCGSEPQEHALRARPVSCARRRRWESGHLFAAGLVRTELDRNSNSWSQRG